MSQVQLSTGEVGVLLLADGMVVVAESEERLQHNLQIVSDMLSRWELQVNWRKTKVIRVARDSQECEMKIGDEVIEQVDAMKYLGEMISSDGNMEKKTEARIGNATRVIGRMNDTVLRRKELSWSTKMKAVNATVMPVGKKRQLKVQATNECAKEDRRLD